MIEQHLLGNLHNQLLQIAQVAGAADHGSRLQILEHEVAERKLLADVVAQFDQQRLRILRDKADAQFLGRRAHTLLRRLQQERHLRIIFFNQFAEVDSRIQLFARRRIVLVNNETDVGNHPQQVVLVFFIQFDRLRVVRRQQDLRPGALAQLLLLLVERLLREFAALLQHQLVDRRQVGRIVLHRVFDQQDRLHADLQDVVVGVHPVFDQLDDRQDQVGIAVPIERVIDGRRVLVLDPHPDIARKIGQQHDRNVRLLFADQLRQVENVDLADIEHTDYQIESRIVAQQFERFDRRTDAPERRRIAQVQVDVLVADLHIDPAVLFKRERIVTASDQQYLADAPPHQVAVVDRRVGRDPADGILCHNLIRIVRNKLTHFLELFLPLHKLSNNPMANYTLEEVTSRRAAREFLDLP